MNFNVVERNIVDQWKEVAVVEAKWSVTVCVLEERRNTRTRTRDEDSGSDEIQRRQTVAPT